MNALRIMAGHHGQRGDLAINLPAIADFHEQSGIEIDMPINRQFADMIPLFMNLRGVNPVVTENYEKFNGRIDKDLVKTRKYDKVLNPMSPHRMDRWFDHMHQTDAVAFDYFNRRLSIKKQQIKLSRWFTIEKRPKTIALAAFAGSYAPGNSKMMTKEMAQSLVDSLIWRGFNVIQLGAPSELWLRGADFPKFDYFQSVKIMLGCDALIHADTGLGWVCSGYKHPQLGLYSNKEYGEQNICNIQPRNPNARYLSAPNINEISLDSILESVDTLLS